MTMTIRSIRDGSTETSLHGLRARSFKQQASYFHEPELQANRAAEIPVEINKAMDWEVNRGDNRDEKWSLSHQKKRRAQRAMIGISEHLRRQLKIKDTYTKMRAEVWRASHGYQCAKRVRFLYPSNISSATHLCGGNKVASGAKKNQLWSPIPSPVVAVTA
jgi:hypothetical protein